MVILLCCGGLASLRRTVFSRGGSGSKAQIRFLDTFLLYCLLADSPQDSREESALMGSNQLAVVERGREPGLTLESGNGPVAMQDWAQGLLDGMRPIAALLDDLHNTGVIGLMRQR